MKNERRALNTFHGIRRARKEGGHMGMAPYGCLNRITETGKKHIAPEPKAAALVLWIFEQIAKEAFSTSIFQMAKDRGLQISKSNFG